MKVSRGHALAAMVLAIATAALLLAAVPGGWAAPPPGPVVSLQSGRVRGIARGGLMIFKGIPYAQPPVGRL
ncbi:MAG: hypothetical protein ACRD2F_15545, partial [Terriglobales bacterium]